MFTERAQELQAASQKLSRYGQRDRGNRTRHESRRPSFKTRVCGKCHSRRREEAGEDCQYLPAFLELRRRARAELTLFVFSQNGLLQELAEEWERCEKKLKDVGHWLEATARTLETPQNAKKPLRDRLALREKLINDISTQKTKISYAVEKLNVSLRSDLVLQQ